MVVNSDLDTLSDFNKSVVLVFASVETSDLSQSFEDPLLVFSNIETQMLVDVKELLSDQPVQSDEVSLTVVAVQVLLHSEHSEVGPGIVEALVVLGQIREI